MIELILCTILNGASFLAQKAGVDHFGPFAINCYRCLSAGAFLWLVSARRGRVGRIELTYGGIGGVLLFVALVTQQIGIEYTTPGVSAFLTANYVLIIPIIGVFIGRRTGWATWIAVAAAVVGTWLICVGGPFGMGKGEIWTLLCAVAYALQIMVLDRGVRNGDPLKFCQVEMLVAGLVALPFVFLPSEVSRASWDAFAAGLPALLFLGVGISGISHILQCLGQKKISVVIASIVLSLESVFAAVFGWLVMGDAMTMKQIAGCTLVFAAVIVSQVSSSRAAAR